MGINEQMIDHLNRSIEELEKAIELDKRLNSTTHKKEMFKTLLAQLKWLRDSEYILLKKYLSS